MLKWPERARRSVAAFFVKWNDFDVFVEDTAKVAGTMYSSYLSRFVREKCKVTSVFPLGDRSKVIQAALADVGSGGRPRIYIVDGDLDLIAGISLVSAPRLFVHDVYHVENYFLCRDALAIVLHEENPRYDLNTVTSMLDFGGWLAEIRPLLQLFSVFGLTRALDPSLPTISLGIGTFCTNQVIDINKIRTFCTSRVHDIEGRFQKFAVDAAKAAIDQSVRLHPEFVDLISAREYLLPTLRWWVGRKGLQLPAGKESLLFRLSKLSSIDRHRTLHSAINTCATAGTI